MASRFIRDTSGVALLEMTIVFPVFMLMVMGTLDATMILLDRAAATKATYMGARLAVVSNPVDSAVSSNWLSGYVAAQTGNSCFDSATGAANATSSCPTINTTCTPTAGSGGTCVSTGTYGGTFSDANFTPILQEMRKIYPALTRQNVVVAYKSSGLGYVGRATIPLTVTVSIRCMNHSLYFLGSLMKAFGANWAFTVATGCPAATVTGPALPDFATTLTSEDMATN